MRIVIKLIVLFGLAAVLPLAAHPEEPTSGEDADPGKIRIEITLPSPEAVSKADDLKRLLQDAHQSLEGEESGTFVSQWANQFNYRRLFLNAYRWYSLKRADPKSADHALNLVMMFAASHTAETIGGMAMASAGLQPGTNWFARIILGVVGVGITIPGLDPLCLGLMALYYRYPESMDRGLQIPRVVIVKCTSFLARRLGIAAVMRWMWEDQSAQSWLNEKIANARPGTYVFEQTVYGYHFALGGEAGGPSPLRLKLIANEYDGRLTLSEIEVSRSSLMTTGLDESSRHWLSLFGLNVKEAVVESAALLARREEAQLKQKNYFNSLIENSAGLVTIKFNSDALTLSAGRNLRPWNWAKSAYRSCVHLLRQH